MNTKHPRTRLLPTGRVLALSLVLSLLVLVCASLVVPVLPGGSRTVPVALASGGGGGNGCCGTITLDTTAHLLARTTLVVSGTFSCALQTPNPPATLDFAQVFVTVSQASGRQIVQATGTFSPSTCDGTVHLYQVDVTPAGGSASFHGGQAIADGSLQVSYHDAFFTFFSFFVDTGNQVIKIQG